MYSNVLLQFRDPLAMFKRSVLLRGAGCRGGETRLGKEKGNIRDVVLGTCTCTCHLERVFSHGGLIITAYRSRMADKTLSSLVFLKCNTRFSCTLHVTLLSRVYDFDNQLS